MITNCEKNDSSAGMPSAAVSSALTIDVSWAKQIATTCRDDGVKKSLWLTIAKYIIRTDSTDGTPGSEVRAALGLLGESCGLLKIEVPYQYMLCLLPLLIFLRRRTYCRFYLTSLKLTSSKTTSARH